MKLKQKRTEIGMTLRTLAIATKIDSKSIVRHESGAIVPSIPTLKKYAKALSCTISEIAELKKCAACGDERPITLFLVKKRENEFCVDCRKTETTIRGTDRPFSEDEGMVYRMGLTRGQTVREIAGEHNRSIAFVREVLHGQG